MAGRGAGPSRFLRVVAEALRRARTCEHSSMFAIYVFGGLVVVLGALRGWDAWAKKHRRAIRDAPYDKGSDDSGPGVFGQTPPGDYHSG